MILILVANCHIIMFGEALIKEEFTGVSCGAFVIKLVLPQGVPATEFLGMKKSWNPSHTHLYCKIKKVLPFNANCNL